MEEQEGIFVYCDLLPSFSFLYPLFLLWMLFGGCLGLHLRLRGKVGTTSQNSIKDASMTGDGGDGTRLREDKTPDLGLNSTLGIRSKGSLGDNFWSEHFTMTEGKRGHHLFHFLVEEEEFPIIS